MSDFFTSQSTRTSGSDLQSGKLAERRRLAQAAMEGKLDAYLSGGGFGLPHHGDFVPASEGFRDAANQYATQRTVGGRTTPSRSNVAMDPEEIKAYKAAAAVALDYLRGNRDAFANNKAVADSMASGIIRR